MSKRKIIFFSPLPPQRNGIADYSARFLGELSEAFDVLLVVEDGVVDPHPVPRTAWMRLSEYLGNERDFAKLQHLYQIGNNRDHGYMLQIMQRHPGLTTLHDLSLHHLIDTIVGHKISLAYQELVQEAYGIDGLALTRDILKRNERPVIFHVELDFIPLISARSRAIVTHSLTGQLRLNAAAPDLPVYRIAHPYQAHAKVFQGNRELARAKARAELGLASDTLILLSLGFVTQAKRIDLSLEAVARILATGRRVLYIVAGEVDRVSYDLYHDIERLNLKDAVLVTQYIPDDKLLTYFVAADVLINLRYPTVGETSGTITNALAVGCCSVVTAIGSFDELPAHCAVKIPVEDMTPEGLFRRLLPLVDSPSLREYYEVNALRYAQLEWSPDGFVNRYIDVIEDTFQSKPRPSAIGSRDHLVFKPSSARRDIDRIALRIWAPLRPKAQMWWRSLMLPVAEERHRLLALGESADVKIAEQAFAWSGHVETELAADREGAFDVVLIVQDVAEFSRSPLDRLFLANKALGIGGSLVFNLTGASLETVNEYFSFPESSSRKEQDEILSPLTALLAAAGFRIERTEDRFWEVCYIEPNFDPVLDPDEHPEFCIQAVKISHKVSRHSDLFLKRY